MQIRSFTEEKHYQITVKTNADSKNSMTNQIKGTTKVEFINDQKNRSWVEYGMAQGSQTDLCVERIAAEERETREGVQRYSTDTELGPGSE